MRSFLLGLFIFALLTGGIVGGLFAMNRYSPGNVGTPAHAGAISNGHPEQCTNVDFVAKARGEARRMIFVDENEIVRGTFQVDGGFGRVDILMRIVDPQGKEMFVSPKATNFDFTFPAKLRGDYTLVFDNGYSMYRSKAIGLYYCIDKGAPLSAGSGARIS